MTNTLNKIMHNGDEYLLPISYTAWEWIEIKNGDDYSAMRWPSPIWFHIPTRTEWIAVRDIWTALWGSSSDGPNFWIALKLPFNWLRASDASISNVGTNGAYYTCTAYRTDDVYWFQIRASEIAWYITNRSVASAIRCFKDSPVTPTSSWTKLYWTSIEAGGIFWSSSEWLISLSDDWQAWTTIADKNLWATTVWNSWDALSQANCGKYYQWGNNYWFPFTWAVTTSSTQVDASNYWPWNYYSSSTFITTSWTPWDWSSVQNDNLWWWVTWVVTRTNAITNTGVLSVNWQIWDVTIEEWITKIFTLADTSDTATAQEIYNWYVAGNYPIVYKSLKIFTLSWVKSNEMRFTAIYNTDTSITSNKLSFTISSWTVTGIVEQQVTINA